MPALEEMHAFDTAIILVPIGEGRYRGHTSAPYNNMVGPFGGLTAAILLRAVEEHPSRLGDPVTLTVNFAAPVTPGEFTVIARAVRKNRSTQHWSIELIQDNTIVTTATAVFGTRRDVWSDTEATPPTGAAPNMFEPEVFPEFITWARNYDMRYVRGGLSQLPSSDSRVELWARDHPPRPLDFAALTALSDVFYPRIFQRRGKYVPAGTISLTIHYLCQSDDITAQSEDYILARAVARRFAAGYFDQSAELWGNGDALLATSHQIVYYKD